MTFLLLHTHQSWPDNPAPSRLGGEWSHLLHGPISHVGACKLTTQLKDDDHAPSPMTAFPVLWAFENLGLALV